MMIRKIFGENCFDFVTDGLLTGQGLFAVRDVIVRPSSVPIAILLYGYKGSFLL